MGFFNYAIEDEKLVAHFYYINNFVDSILINNDFSNSELPFVHFGGVTGEGNNFDNVILGCVTLLEGHANEEAIC